MAMIQNTNEVHFTGMTRVELEGNKIIATQNGESQVTIAANTRSLAELAGKINESTAKKETVTDQEMLDRDVVERYSGYSGQYRIRSHNSTYFPYGGRKMTMPQFIEFYLSANRLGYSLYDMRECLCIPENAEQRYPEREYSTYTGIMSVGYLEARIKQASRFAKSRGFVLPPLRNVKKTDWHKISEDSLGALNWAG